ncbi:hypothetical protein [uncultured Imperialibacter sp.]|uniref:hypothetical protein n=1 Tax=uncultured Imperialibacter sp. TaxID=1672639 RepID=UPI0030D75598|tara:strand:+ start:4274 stop:5524 length:1251 start_codon:yes stop_codon:yes gene_type:complete
MNFNRQEPAFMRWTMVLLIGILCQQSAWGQERKIDREKLGKIFKSNSTQLREATFQQEQAIPEINIVENDEITLRQNQLKAVRFGDKVEVAGAEAREVLQQQETRPVFTTGDTTISPEQLIPEVFVLPGQTESQDIRYYIFFTSALPLQYDFSENAFLGNINFILLPESGSGHLSTIDPVFIEPASLEIGGITPGWIEIDHLNLPSSSIKLIATDHLKDSAELRLRTRLNPEGYITKVGVKSPLTIKARKKFAQGYGIQEVPVEVILKGIGSGSAEIRFLFEEGAGTLSEESFVLNNNETKTVYIRSQGDGPVKLAAFSTGFSSNPERFQYDFPYTFLLFTLIGGLIGASVKYLKSDSKFSWKSFSGGVLVGLLAVGLWYVLGISILSISLDDVYNEGSVLLISAVGAWGVGLKWG